MDALERVGEPGGYARVTIDVVADPAGAASKLYSKRPNLLNAGGGLASTVRDYHRFALMLLRGGTLDGGPYIVLPILGPSNVRDTTGRISCVNGASECTPPAESCNARDDDCNGNSSRSPVYAALGLGVLNKLLEGWAGAVLAKIMVLVFIVIFIQKRPQGIFAMKGRSAEA